MIKIFITLTILAVSTTAFAASPTINSVTGTASNGQILTINGSNLVQEDKTNWQTDFKNSYGFEGSSYTADGWILSGGQHTPVYDSTVKLSGNKSFKFRISGASVNGPGGLTSYVHRNSTAQDIWIRGYVKLYSANNLWATSHSKMIDWQGTGYQYYFQPGPGSSLPVNMTSVYDGANHFGAGSISSDDKWHLFELHWKSTSPHVFTTYWDNVLIGNASPTNIGSMTFILLGFINAAGTTSSFDATYWFDNFAVSSSRIYPSSTIEISGDGTNWKYQHPVYLSDTLSQFKVDLSGVTGTNYRLRVTNNQQQTSTIYTLSGSGGGGGGDIQAPTTPSSLTASAVSSSQINLSWPASTDNTAVTGYKIYRGGTYLATSTGTSFTNTGLTASTSYSYKVSAIDAAGNESGQSPTATATTQAAAGTDTTAPSIPSGLSANVTSSSQINLSWTASTDNVGVTGYKIYRGGALVATSTTTAYVDTGLSASTSYSYKVSAIDAAGNESGQSASTSATTQAAAPGAGGTVLLQESFDNSSFATRGWYDTTTHGTIVTGGQSGSSLQWAWAQGAQKPTNGGAMRKKITPTDSLYVSFYVKFQTGWRGSQKTYHPHMFLVPSDLDSDYAPLANNYLNTYIEFVSDVGGTYAVRPLMAIQDEMRVNTAYGTPPNNLTAITENRSVAYCNTPVPAGVTGMCYADYPYYSANTWKASTASASTNVWHKVEVYLKMNTISGGKGQSNGIMQQWLDGTQVINRSDVLYRTAQDPTKKWAQFVLAPWIGDGSPIAQTMWLDELTVATAPPASSGGGDVLPPTAPSGLAATAVSSSQINLAWTASTDNVGVTGYKIYRNGTYLATSTATSYTNTGLTASTSYNYKVSAIDAAGNESAQSAAATVTTQAAPDTTAPSVPSGLSASATSSTQINLAWTASTDNVGVTGYKIYRNGTYLAASTATSYTNTGLTASTSYSYKVSAIDAAGNESAQSVAATVTTQAAPDTTAPSVPSGLSASATSSTQINLAWTASTDNVGVAAYKIYRGGTNIATSRTTSYTDSGLTAATAYTYKVSAVDAAGNESGQSVAATATTQPAVVIDTTAPSVPAGLSASATSSTQISLSWTASTDNVGVTGYKVYRNGALVATATTTTHADSGLTPSTAYNYKVSALDAAGNESAQSAAASVTTQAGSTGGTALLQESFDNNSFATRGWYDNTTHGTIVSGGQSGSSLQWAWAQGATKPTNGGAMRKKFAPTESLYVSFFVKFQTGWQGSQKNYHPHMIQIPSDLDSDWTALAENYLNTYIEFSSDIGGSYAIRPQLAIQDQKRVNTANGTPPNNLTAITENRSVAHCNTPASAGATGVCYAATPYYSANLWEAPTSTVSTNVWHKVEVYLKMNTVSSGKGQANGVMQQWIDGAQVINRNDVLYRTGQDPTKKWAQFVLAPWIGDGSPIAQTMWLDELTVSTAPPRVPLKAPAGFKIVVN